MHSQFSSVDRGGSGWNIPLGIFLLKTLIVAILFFPKINLFYLPGFSVAVKIEDLIWGLLVISLFQYRNRLGNVPALIFAILIVYIALSALIFPGNIVLGARLFFYAIPIIFFFRLHERDFEFFVNTFKLFARVYALVAVLQITTPFAFVHTGDIYTGVVAERAPGIFGNGVEFALVAYMSIWLLRFLNNLTLTDYCCFLTIGLCTGSRVATAGILLSGLVIFGRQYLLRSAVVVPLILLPLSYFVYSFGDSRIANVDPLSLFTATQALVSNISGKELAEANVGDYCFSFDDGLSDDQSFAMRLAKAKFVLEYVVLGAHPFGFGLGNCIGDAGDNLYVRVLSDGGYPYFFLLCAFFISLLTTKRFERRSREWKYFIFLFLGISLFYDTLYLSRVAPLFFLILMLLYQRGLGSRIQIYR